MCVMVGSGHPPSHTLLVPHQELMRARLWDYADYARVRRLLASPVPRAPEVLPGLSIVGSDHPFARVEPKALVTQKSSGEE